jgi:hypothetical protein
VSDGVTPFRQTCGARTYEYFAIENGDITVIPNSSTPTASRSRKELLGRHCARARSCSFTATSAPAVEDVPWIFVACGEKSRQAAAW